MFFQRLDAFADGRLTDMKRFGRFGKAFFLGYFDEVGQLE